MRLHEEPTMSAKTLSAALLLCLPFLPAQAPGTARAQAPIISIDFPGGSLRDLIQAIRAGDPHLNITASSLAQDVPMPPLSLKGATVLSVLNAAAAVAPLEYAVLCSDIAQGQPGEPVYAVVVQSRQPMTTAAPPTRRQVNVYSLRSLVEPQPSDPKDKPVALTTETVLSAIEAGLRLGGQEPAEMKYHRDSGLLFVNGLPGQINVVQDVLRSLLTDQVNLRDVLARERMRQESTTRGGEAPGKVDKE
jgi:hypothetical protein